MKRILLILAMGLGTNVHAQVCATVQDVQNNAGYNRELLKTAVINDVAPVATKADLAAAVANLQASVAASLAALQTSISKIGTTTVVTPPPPPPPPPVAQGIFIGTTQYNHLADAAAAYKPGDTVHLTQNLDNESGAFVTGDVTILCDPGVKLTWSGGTSLRPAWGKGFFVFEGTTKNATVKGCEASGMVLDGPDGGNAAAIRSTGLTSLTVDSVNFHECNDGILGGATTVTITNSKFARNGVNTGGTANVHNIYIDQNTVNLNVSDSYFGPVTPGNLFKSRAQNTTCTRCVFDSNGLDGSYEIDIPNGGNALIQNSVIYKAVGQSQHYMLSYGVEGILTDGRVNNYEFRNNVVLTDDTAHMMNGSGNFNFHDNLYVGSIDMTVAGTNNQVFATRAAAGLPVAPTLPAAK